MEVDYGPAHRSLGWYVAKPGSEPGLWDVTAPCSDPAGQRPSTSLHWALGAVNWLCGRRPRALDVLILKDVSMWPGRNRPENRDWKLSVPSEAKGTQGSWKPPAVSSAGAAAPTGVPQSLGAPLSEELGLATGVTWAAAASGSSSDALFLQAPSSRWAVEHSSLLFVSSEEALVFRQQKRGSEHELSGSRVLLLTCDKV